MGFNWRYALGSIFLITILGFAWPIWGNVLAVFAITGAIMLDRVARHNVRQVFRRGGHQWVGDGRECKVCKYE